MEKLEGVMTMEQVLEAEGVEYARVPGWKDKEGQSQDVAIMSITAGEVLEWIESKDDPERSREAGLRLIARSLVGPDGQRLCTNREGEDTMVRSLRNKDSRTCNRIVEAILTLNGISVKGPEIKND